MDAVIFEPHYPVSGLFRLIRDDDGLQVDFMTRIHGVRSFNSLRARASEMDMKKRKSRSPRWLISSPVSVPRIAPATGP